MQIMLLNVDFQAILLFLKIYEPKKVDEIRADKCNLDDMGLLFHIENSQ